ncbi:MAG: autotransporter-associated beta strand repeat-containing protein [Planctomycetaceae bacterium]|nr:autotransporter-associated beta strand repeat-containing protein [Planctomycetaceae bacterium]
MKRNFLWQVTVIAVVLAGFSGASFGQTSLSVGDVQVIGVTSDDDDSFTFVLWRDIAANTTLRFMDHSFTNATNGLTGNESDMSLQFNSAVNAGSVIRVLNNGATLVNGGAFSGTKSGSLSGISASGDQVFVYQGTAVGGTGTSFSGRTLLHGFNIANTNWRTSGTADSNSSYLPSSINVADANFDSDNFDNADYSGTRSGLTTAAYRAAVSNITNYTQNDTRFDLATGGFAVNSSASLHWDANGTSVGNGNSGTWDTTTVNRFKNSASGSTYLRWVNSSLGNQHTAVFGGTAGTVSVAASGVTASGLDFQTDGYVIQNNTITLTGTPDLNVATGTATINSVLAGSVMVNKTGAGTLVLGGANIYNGNTQVADGVLVVASTGSLGTSSASVLVDANAELVVNGSVDAMSLNVDGKLSGSGLIDSASVTINGTLGPGNSIDELSVIGDLSFTAGSIFDVEINSNLLTSDLLTVDGNLELGSSTLNLSDLSFLTRTTGTLTIANYSGNLTGEFDSLTDGSLINVGGNVWTLSYGSRNGGAITLSAVPEPSALLLVGSIIGAGLLRRRRA